MTSIDAQRRLMQLAIATLRSIDLTSELFGFDEEYKKTKIASLQDSYADIMVQLMQELTKVNPSVGHA